MTIFLLLIFCTTPLVAMKQDEQTSSKTHAAHETSKELFDALQRMNIVNKEQRERLEKPFAAVLSSQYGPENSFLVTYAGGFFFSLTAANDGKTQLNSLIEAEKNKGYKKFTVRSFSGQE